MGATLFLSEGAPDHPGPGRMWRPGRAAPDLGAGRLPHADPGAARPRRRAGAGARPLAACASSARPASPGTPSPIAGCFERRRRGALPDHQPVRRHRGRRLLPLADAGDAAQGVHAGHAVRWAWRWRCWARTARRCAPGEVGELVCTKPWPSMTRGDLGRPGALPGDVLVALAGDLGARRLGLGGRGRLLVPARPQRRHAQHRRQADRAGRVRVGRGRPPGRRRGLCGRHAATSVKGEVAWLYLVPRPGVEPSDELAAEVRAHVGHELGKAFAPGRVAWVTALPEDPQRQDRAPRRARRRAGRGARRPLLAREPAGARAVRTWNIGVRPLRSTATPQAHSSPTGGTDGV